MSTIVEIPTQSGPPFVERLVVNNITYTLRFVWNNCTDTWVVDFWDAGNVTEVLTGVPIVTGCDLLEQFQYLALGANAAIMAMTIGPAKSPDTPPTDLNFGSDGHLYLITP